MYKNIICSCIHVFPLFYYLFSYRLTAEEQKDWEEKLTKYAYEVSITCNILLGIDKIVKEKLSGKPLGVLDSLIQAVYAGLLKVYDMLSTAEDQVKKGQKPDFTGDIPFPPAPPPLPEPSQAPSWFQIAWNTVEDALNLLAEKNAKIAEFLPPIEAAGDELVKDLEKYFPSTGFEAGTLSFAELDGFPKRPAEI